MDLVDPMGSWGVWACICDLLNGLYSVGLLRSKWKPYRLAFGSRSLYSLWAIMMRECSIVMNDETCRVWSSGGGFEVHEAYSNNGLRYCRDGVCIQGIENCDARRLRWVYDILCDNWRERARYTGDCNVLLIPDSKLTVADVFEKLLASQWWRDVVIVKGAQFWGTLSDDRYEVQSVLHGRFEVHAPYRKNNSHYGIEGLCIQGTYGWKRKTLWRVLAILEVDDKKRVGYGLTGNVIRIPDSKLTLVDVFQKLYASQVWSDLVIAKHTKESTKDRILAVDGRDGDRRHVWKRLRM